MIILVNVNEIKDFLTVKKWEIYPSLNYWNRKKKKRYFPDSKQEITFSTINEIIQKKKKTLPTCECSTSSCRDKQKESTVKGKEDIWIFLIKFYAIIQQCIY